MGLHAALLRIVGDWVTEGHVVGEPAIPVRGSDVYEAFPGNHFLVHHVDVTVGTRPVRAIEIIGEAAPDGDGFLARSFDADGNVELMRLRVDDDGVFHFEGGGDVAAATGPGESVTARVRSTLTVASDRRSMTALWERTEDGAKWLPWMRIGFARRAQSPTAHVT
jgi:hypothetical protein